MGKRIVIMAALGGSFSIFAIVAACGDDNRSSFGPEPDARTEDVPGFDEVPGFPTYPPVPDPDTPEVGAPFRACEPDAGSDAAEGCAPPEPTCFDDAGFAENGRWVAHFENGRCVDAGCVWDVATTYCRYSVGCYHRVNALDGGHWPAACEPLAGR